MCLFPLLPWLALLLLLLLLIPESIGGDDVASNSSVLQNFSGRIVNGTRAAPKQFPQQVSLRRLYSDSHFCGGSIIAPEWVLTASHCMFERNGLVVVPHYSVRVVAGEVLLVDYDEAHQKSAVVRIIVHDKFDPWSLHNDVALLKLESPFKFDPFVRPAPLARRSTRDFTVCRVSGWGYPKFNQEEVSYYLKYVELPLLPIPVCKEYLKEYSEVPAGMICAGYEEGGMDACQGDSGGGLVCNGTLTGVVSGGEGCAWPKLPGLYADVQHYVEWIERYVDTSREYNVSSVPRKNSASTRGCCCVLSLALAFATAIGLWLPSPRLLSV